MKPVIAVRVMFSSLSQDVVAGKQLSYSYLNGKIHKYDSREVLLPWA